MTKLSSALAISVLILNISGCGNKSDVKLDFKVYECDMASDRCGEDYEIWKFKVRKFEKTVLVSIFDAKGTPKSNAFYNECDIYNRLNWYCVASNEESMPLDMRMVEGNLITGESKANNQGFKLYQKYVRAN